MDHIPVPASNPAPVIDGWLFWLCFQLILIVPAGTLYRITTNTWLALVRPSDPIRMLLAGVYLVVFMAIAVLSFTAGIRLWAIKPDAVRLAQIFFRMFLCAHLGYLALWCLLMRPNISVSLARMIEAHMALPLPFFFVWTSYLEHSKRVKETYSPK